MKEVFGTEDIDNTCSQKTCIQWDSMAQINLVIELESSFDISLEPEEIGQMRDFKEVLHMVEKKVLNN